MNVCVNGCMANYVKFFEWSRLGKCDINTDHMYVGSFVYWIFKGKVNIVPSMVERNNNPNAVNKKLLITCQPILINMVTVVKNLKPVITELFSIITVS